ncbi:MAG: hypothetical protein HOY79_17930 [Streptomyces sp.]|nr:hypothetical protein [Streptomyces sp.]
MNVLAALRNHQNDAEYDTAVWIDDHARLGRAVRFLAHHRVLRAAVLALAAPVIAIPAAVLAVREAGRLIDRTHEVAGEGTDPCRTCVTREADVFAASGDLSYEDFCHALDLGDAL